jgi:fucose permease
MRSAKNAKNHNKNQNMQTDVLSAGPVVLQVVSDVFTQAKQSQNQELIQACVAVIRESFMVINEWQLICVRNISLLRHKSGGKLVHDDLRAEQFVGTLTRTRSLLATILTCFTLARVNTTCIDQWIQMLDERIEQWKAGQVCPDYDSVEFLTELARFLDAASKQSDKLVYGPFVQMQTPCCFL